MNAYRKMIEDKLAENRSEARALLEKAETRQLSAGEMRRVTEIREGIQESKQVFAQIDAEDKTRAASERSLKALSDTPKSFQVRTAADEEVDQQFRSAILEKNPAPIVVRNAAPRSYFQPGVEARAIGVGSPANTSMGVGFYGQVIQNLVETSAVLRSGATVISTENGEPMRIPRQTAYSSAALVTEGSVIPAGDPSLSAVTLGAYKYAVLITVSNELVEDAGFDLTGYLAAETGVALGNALGADLINGSGTGAPTGVLTSASLGIPRRHRPHRHRDIAGIPGHRRTGHRPPQQPDRFARRAVHAVQGVRHPDPHVGTDRDPQPQVESG